MRYRIVQYQDGTYYAQTSTDGKKWEPMEYFKIDIPNSYTTLVRGRTREEVEAIIDAEWTAKLQEKRRSTISHVFDEYTPKELK